MLFTTTVNNPILLIPYFKDTCLLISIDSTIKISATARVDCTLRTFFTIYAWLCLATLWNRNLVRISEFFVQIFGNAMKNWKLTDFWIKVMKIEGIKIILSRNLWVQQHPLHPRQLRPWTMKLFYQPLIL